MKRIGPPDIFCLRAAYGWLGLGDWDSARDELWQIAPRLRGHPDVVSAHCALLEDAERWEDLLPVAETLFRIAPEDAGNWLEYSFALHRMGRTQRAYDFLLPAAAKFPADWTIRYNLACFGKELGRLDEARQWLGKTFELGDSKEVKLAALADRDLEPFWADIVATGCFGYDRLSQDDENAIKPLSRKSATEF